MTTGGLYLADRNTDSFQRDRLHVDSRLHDEHLADELHPSGEGAKIIAEEVFNMLKAVHAG